MQWSTRCLDLLGIVLLTFFAHVTCPGAGKINHTEAYLTDSCRHDGRSHSLDARSGNQDDGNGCGYFRSPDLGQVRGEAVFGKCIA